MFCCITARDREVNCWLEFVENPVNQCVCVSICCRGSLLLQPHPVCETLRRACLVLGVPHSIITHIYFLLVRLQEASCLKAPPKKRDQMFSFFTSIFISLCFSFSFNCLPSRRQTFRLELHARTCNCLCEPLCGTRERKMMKRKE